MEDVILIIAVIAVMIFGFFIMKRLDVFLEENRKAIAKEREEKYSPFEFIDTENFMMLIYKYNSFEELTPEILRAFIEKVVVRERTKVDGHYRPTVEIFYNFVGAIDRPIWGDELTDKDD